ncbi:MAG: hypothetical protein M3Q56_01270, partial [Bacteroidota bacterium]|nr:hypothetical protein [Bacteroidota bacterium]
AHFKLMNEHARNHYPISNIILVSKSAEESKSKYFNDNGLYKDNIQEKIIREDELVTSQNPILTPLLHAEGPTVFLLPLALSKDEKYIYHFLRRVSHENAGKEIIVYGTYKWLEMKSDIMDYINTQKVRLTISNYVNSEDAEIRNFKKKYFQEYREFPSEDAVEGYDLIKFIINSIRNYDMDIDNKISKNNYTGLQTQFIITPVYKNKLNPSRNELPDYYENSYVRMVEIRNNNYKILD